MLAAFGVIFVGKEDRVIEVLNEEEMHKQAILI